MRTGDMRFVVFGNGYCGAATARLAARHGIATALITRDPARAAPHAGITIHAFDAAAGVLATATHVLATAPPDSDGDPVLRAHGAALASAPALRWLGYLSTTGVYGDRGGAWVDEATPVAPGSPRAARRVAAEQEWARLADRCAVDLFRLAGIYGPGRSALDDLRAGRARRVVKPGHEFGRIHRDDVAGSVLAALGQDLPPGMRVLNLSDDTPAPTADVVAEAARLLGMPAPPAIDYAVAVADMSEMARSFWAENRRVSSKNTQRMLGRTWRYPSYREGLRAILGEERLNGADQ